jgi:hypothetical protein
MTERKATTRPRRRGGPADDIPKALQQWFAGELDSPPWCALVYPSFMLLKERWLAWKSTRPDARPPAGHEWIDGPGSYPAEQVESARKCLQRFARRFPDQAGKW